MNVVDTAGRARKDASALLDELAAIVGADAVLASPEDRLLYSLDFSEEAGAIAMAVVKPQSASQVAAVVRAAGEAGVAVNARGGGMS